MCHPECNEGSDELLSEAKDTSTCVCVGVFRFFIEYLRGDDRGQLLGFISPSQFWSLLMVVIGVVLYFALRAFYKKEDAQPIDVAEKVEAEE